MRNISLFFVLFIFALLHGQDKFPENWHIDKFCNVWDKASNNGLSYTIEYSKASNSVIERNLFLKKDIEFFMENSNFDSIEALSDACYRLFLDISFFTYSDKFNLIFERQFSINSSKKTISGMNLGVMRYHEGIFYEKYNFKAYWNSVFPKNPCNDWDMTYLFKNKSLIYKGKLHEYYYIIGDNCFLKYIRKNIQKYLFCCYVIHGKNFDKNGNVCSELFKRYNNPDNADKFIIEKIKDKISFVKIFEGVWCYNIEKSGKSYKFKFFNKNSTFSVGICSEFLKSNTYIYSQDYTVENLKIIDNKNIDYFYPIMFLFYEPYSGSIILRQDYEFISEKNETLRFNYGSSEYECISNENICFSKKEIIFKGYKNHKIKWEISDDNTEIREYIYENDKWILYSVMKKLIES